MALQGVGVALHGRPKYVRTLMRKRSPACLHSPVALLSRRPPISFFLSLCPARLAVPRGVISNASQASLEANLLIGSQSTCRNARKVRKPIMRFTSTPQCGLTEFIAKKFFRERKMLKRLGVVFQVFHLSQFNRREKRAAHFEFGNSFGRRSICIDIDDAEISLARVAVCRDRSPISCLLGQTGMRGHPGRGTKRFHKKSGLRLSVAGRTQEKRHPVFL
jgi:hypothetical protein